MSSEIINYLRKTGQTDSDKLNQILTALQEIIPQTEIDASKEKIVYGSELRLRTTTVIVGGPSVSSSPQRKRETKWLIRKKPTAVKSYPLTHTTTGTISFPTAGHKWGAIGTFSGTQYITIAETNSSTLMNMGSGAFAFIFWIKLTGIGTHGIFCKRDIANTTNAGIEMWVSGGTTINCRIADGTNTTLISFTSATLNSGSWHSICVNVPSSGNLEIYVDKVSLGTQARGSVGSINNTRSAYFGARDNAGTIQNQINGSLSWWFWETATFSSGSINSFNDDAYISTLNNITAIPLLGDELASPNAESGLFKSS